MQNGLENLLHQLDSVSLKGLDDVKLLNRVDSKYVFHYHHLNSLLQEMQPHYNILDIDNRRIFNYDSLYFDTPDFLLYKFHHNGRPDRLKIRYRTYLDSALTYFEVKYKVKGIRTVKERMRAEKIKDKLGPDELNLVHHKYLDNSVLEKKMWTRFRRITLSGKNLPERATIDLNISFSNNSGEKNFDQLIIAEVKQDKSSVFSPMIQAFKKRFFDEAGFSKYCTGVAMMETVKHNSFKPNLIKIKKILNGNNGCA